MSERIITVESEEQLSELFGQLDGNLANIRKQYDVKIVSRDGNIKVIGDEPYVTEAAKAVEALLMMSGRGQPLSEQTIRYVTSMVADGIEQQLEEHLQKLAHHA